MKAFSYYVYSTGVETSTMLSVRDAAEAVYLFGAFRNDIFIVDSQGVLVAILPHVGYGEYGLMLF